MRNLTSLDKAATVVIPTLLVILGSVLVIGGQAGIRVTASLPQNGLIGPLDVITLKFSEPVDQWLVESLLEVHPRIDGIIQWVDGQTVQIVPIGPYEIDTDYKVNLRSGEMTEDGNELKSDQSWEVRVREPLVAYLDTQNDQSSIRAVDVNGKEAGQLTDPSIKVIGFDTARDGGFIVFYSVNEGGGIDLWRVSHAGGDASILLDCGRDRCTTPAISPDGTRVAYSREAAGPGPDLPYGSPRVWVLDLQSGGNSPVYEDQQILGYNPAWSPDGMQLASFDGLADQIRLLDVVNGAQFIFPSNTGGPITWSPDGTKFLYTDAAQNEFGLRTRVRMADLELNDTFTLIGENDDRDYSYHSLLWSPMDDSVLLGMRAEGDDPAQVLWLFDPGRLDGIVIADQPDYAYNSPRWDVWGRSLVFQQFKLKGVYKPEIGLWQSGFGEPIILAEGLMPHWLP